LSSLANTIGIKFFLELSKLFNYFQIPIIGFKLAEHSTFLSVHDSYFFRKIIHQYLLLAWTIKGKSIPPPHPAKVRIVKEFQRRFNLHCFIETGTYMGDMVYAIKNSFKKIYSIELSHDLYYKAKKRFSNFPHISLIHGDSGKELPKILDLISEPTLFWLDGHYSAGITARGDLETPILSELLAICHHSIKNHVILIDDARCFNGEKDYPFLDELFQMLKKINSDYRIKVRNDIIQAYLP